MTSVYMYDGINSLAAGIARQFPDAPKVAYYVDGIYAWSQAEIGLFPRADHVTIAVRASTNAGDVLDVERYDASPDQAEGWIAMRKAAGLYRPTVYCSRAVVPAVRVGTGRFVLGTDYDLWVADYDGSEASVYPGLAAKQFRSTSEWDQSVVYDLEWPHRKAPAPPQPPSAWPAGMILRPGDTGPAVTVLQLALSDSGRRGVRGIAVDGVFGAQTETSLRNYQAARGLTVDGIAGPQVRAALGV